MIFTPAKYAPYTPKFMTNFHKTMVANSLISMNIQKTQKSVFLMFMNDNIIHVSIALIYISNFKGIQKFGRIGALVNFIIQKLEFYKLLRFWPL